VTLTVEVQAKPSDRPSTPSEPDTLPDKATIVSNEEPTGVPVSTPGPTVTSVSQRAPPMPANPTSSSNQASSAPVQTVSAPAANGTLPTTGGV
jgi:hypothetical protein